jgi:hypothetical protein
MINKDPKTISDKLMLDLFFEIDRYFGLSSSNLTSKFTYATSAMAVGNSNIDWIAEDVCASTMPFDETPTSIQTMT